MKILDAKKGNVIKNKVTGEMYFIGDQKSLYKVDQIPEEPPCLDGVPADDTLTEENAILYSRISFVGEREGLYQISDGNLIYNYDFPVNMGNITAREILDQKGYNVTFIGEMNETLGIYSYNIARDEFNLVKELSDISGSGEYIAQDGFVAYPVTRENPEYDPEDKDSVKEFYSVNVVDTTKNLLYSIDTDENLAFCFLETKRDLIGIALLNVGDYLYLIDNSVYGAEPICGLKGEAVIYDSAFNHSLIINTDDNLVKISYKTGQVQYVLKDNKAAAQMKTSKYVDSYWDEDTKKYAFLNDSNRIATISVKETEDRGTIINVA